MQRWGLVFLDLLGGAEPHVGHVDEDEGGADADGHPQEIPRDAFENFLSPGVAAYPQQFH